MINAIQKELKSQEMSAIRYTENGAPMYETSGKNLLDMNFKVSSYRGMSEQEIIDDFIKAYADDPNTALKWLFYVRDVREGLGERRLFRTVIKHLAKTDKRFDRNFEFIPEYGRWDDLLELYEYNEELVLSILRKQNMKDFIAMENPKQPQSISLLSKWLPSINTSSKAKRNFARKLAKAWGITEREYRKSLTKARAYLDVIEVKTSSNKWGEIDYQKVPSQANLKYRNSFLKHDEERRREYLGKLAKGEVKINATVSFPHDIVHQYRVYDRSVTAATIDEALEGMWKALPNLGLENTLVVADGSGSMISQVPGSNAMALEVANALAIYCSERNSGEFKNKFITFSCRPQFVNLENCPNLLSKLQLASKYCEVANTDIYKVFRLILDTAVKNKMKQEDVVKNVLIISDMEFDSCTEHAGETNFSRINAEFNAAGYQLPRLVFWNVCGRTNAIPLQQNDNGVALVSGFSVNILKMIMSGRIDPYDALLDTLNSDRYKNIYLEGTN